MNVAVIGNGGREHALAKKCLQSPQVENVYVIPGNTGMCMSKNLQIYLDWDGNFPSLETYLVNHAIELIIVGNESYLENGITDYFEKDFMIFGPNKKGANLECSKDYAKQFMKKYHIPTADFHTLSDYEESIEFINASSRTLVIKQDGLAFGKGVLVTQDKREASVFVKESFRNTKKIVFEDFLEGKEFSLLAFVNQEYYNCMIPARDYKRAFDGDLGLNTGGMGAYAPVEYVSDDDLNMVEREIIIPTIDGLLAEDINFSGILYFGLMKTEEGIKVIEYNTRFGDPETEILVEAMESDLVGAIIATLKKEPFTLQWKSGITLGVCMASNGYPSHYEKGYHVEFTQDITCYSMALRKGKDTYVTNGGRVLFVVKNGESIEKVREACYKDVSSIKSPGLFYRTDIGL
jgi:phosphoribosylamine--glycine ligase